MPEQDNSFLNSLAADCFVNASLSEYTTFRLGGRCLCLIHCRTSGQLTETIRLLNEHNTGFILIGSGSNLLVSDEGVNTFIVRYETRHPDICQEGHDVMVSGATRLDDLARFAAVQGLQGLNYTTGIPGTVGGAIVGNAGAFGSQVGDVLMKVTLIDGQGVCREAGPDELGFRYRSSLLKESKEIVVSARFRLFQGDSAQLFKERERILALRREKHPDIRATPCAGSFFKNIEPSSSAGKRQAAGWFLEEAGVKTLTVGGAYVYPKHANIICRKENGTAQDVYALSVKMARAVNEKFGFDLQREVRLVGRFHGLPYDKEIGFG